MKVLAQNLEFPEGPIAMRDGSVCFVELLGGRVSRVNSLGEVTVVAEVGGGPNGLAVGPDEKIYACNNGGFLFEEVDGVRKIVPGQVPADYRGGSIQRIDPQTGQVTSLYTQCGDVPLSGPNDLVFDAHGGFYFTDYGRTRGRSRDIGSVYYALADGSAITEVIHPMSGPNGIGLSPDQKSLYVVETDMARLWAFGIVAPGGLVKLPHPSPHGGRLVCGLPGYQRFDGFAVQADGCICVGTLSTGKITVISPDGDVLREVKMPDSMPTNICFGGPDLRNAYITLSTTGQVVEMEWPVAGLALNHYA